MKIGRAWLASAGVSLTRAWTSASASARRPGAAPGTTLPSTAMAFDALYWPASTAASSAATVMLPPEMSPAVAALIGEPCGDSAPKTTKAVVAPSAPAATCVAMAFAIVDAGISRLVVSSTMVSRAASAASPSRA